MARRRYFYGKSQEWLEAELAKAQEDLSSGTTNIGGTAGDSSFTEQAHLSPQDRIDALLLELYYLDPDNYPRAVAKPARITRGILRPTYNC